MALTLTSAEPARVRWIDALRGFIMILMVFGHVWAGIKNAGILKSGPVFEMTYSWIYFFHMPTLFVLSGMLYSEPSYGRGLITENTRRVFRFLYPLVLWSYVYYTFKFIFADMVNTPVTLVEVLLGPLPPKDHFWFLWALFLIQLGASLLLAIFARLPGGRNNYAFGIVGLVIAVAMFYLPGIRTAWTAPAIGMAAFFFFGVLLSRFRLANMPINTASATIGLAVFAAVPTIVVAAGLQELDLIGVALQCFCILGLIAFDMGQRALGRQPCLWLPVQSRTGFDGNLLTSLVLCFRCSDPLAAVGDRRSAAAHCHGDALGCTRTDGDPLLSQPAVASKTARHLNRLAASACSQTLPYTSSKRSMSSSPV